MVVVVTICVISLGMDSCTSGHAGQAEPEDQQVLGGPPLTPELFFQRTLCRKV